MSLQWFPCYVNDLLGSMRWKCMTPAQRGAYWQLICWQMQAEDGHLPAEAEQLCALSDLDLSGPNACVLEAFPIDSTGRRANVRALREWHKRRSVSDERRVAGAKGNDLRWQRDRNCDQVGIANGSPLLQHPQPQPQAQPEATPTTTPRRRASKPAPDGFAEFWAAYPRKEAKPVAEKAWQRHVLPTDIPAIMAKLKLHCLWDQWTKDNGKYIPLPATWINQRRWEDEGIIPPAPVAKPEPRYLDDGEKMRRRLAETGGFL